MAAEGAAPKEIKLQSSDKDMFSVSQAVALCVAGACAGRGGRPGGRSEKQRGGSVGRAPLAPPRRRLTRLSRAACRRLLRT